MDSGKKFIQYMAGLGLQLFRSLLDKTKVAAFFQSCKTFNSPSGDFNHITAKGMESFGLGQGK